MLFFIEQTHFLMNYQPLDILWPKTIWTCMNVVALDDKISKQVAFILKKDCTSTHFIQNMII